MKAMTLLMLPAFLLVDSGRPVHGQSAVEARVRALDDAERLAALQRDTTELKRLWSEQFVANGPNNKVVADKRALMMALVPRSSYVREVEFIRIEGDFALLMGLETLIAATDAPGVGLVAGRPTRRRFTHVWRREGDTWRLYARHANVIPDR